MNKNDEKILVVESRTIFSKGKWEGLKKDNLAYYLSLIKDNYQFKRKGEVEENPFYQQIIPYIIFNYQNKFFIYRYLEKAGESRLINTYQIGIGGHINFSDEKEEDILEGGMMREWEEEIDYQGNIIEKKLIGILNDESRMVEKVHLGLVYLFRGDSPFIFIKEKEKMEGELADRITIKEIVQNNYGSVWTRIIYNEYLEKA